MKLRVLYVGGVAIESCGKSGEILRFLKNRDWVRGSKL